MGGGKKSSSDCHDNYQTALSVMRTEVSELGSPVLIRVIRGLFLQAILNCIPRAEILADGKKVSCTVYSRDLRNYYYNDLSPANNSIYNRAGLLLDATISNFFGYEKYRLRALL